MFNLLVKFHYKVKLKLKNSLNDFGGFQSLELREKNTIKTVIFVYLVFIMDDCHFSLKPKLKK